MSKGKSLDELLKDLAVALQPVIAEVMVESGIVEVCEECIDHTVEECKNCRVCLH